MHFPDKSKFKAVCLPWVVSTALISVSQPLLAAAPPASLQEMWNIIQQQQKEIEALKSKASQADALQEEVKALKQAQGATATQPAPAPESRKAGKSDSDRKTEILATEVEKLKSQLVIPDTREYKSQYGLGPAASNVYRVNRGLSLGGYGEAIYTNYTGHKGEQRDTFDLLRAVLYAGYKFNDWIVLNNEIEFEHASTGEGDEKKGEVSVEFSQLDFFLHPMANIRAGLMLMPMGFINEMHEPTTFHGTHRPDVERYIIPSTWREMGAGLFGELLPGLQYRMYAVNGLNARNFESSGIREGRQGGTKALAENFAFTGRLDYTPRFAPGLLVGGAAYVGEAGQRDTDLGRKGHVTTQLYEGHLQWHYRGLELRALGAWGHIGQAGLLSEANYLASLKKDPSVSKETIGKESYGWYTEAAYDLMPLLWKDSTQYLAPFVRYERFDTLAKVPTGFWDDGSYDRRIYQAGLTYKPIPNVAIKADYRNISAASGQQPHEFNLGLGFIY
jgi:hypothetical protein